MKAHRFGRLHLQLALCAGLSACTAAWADEIRLANGSYTDVTVRGFDGEFVIFLRPNGETAAVKLGEISAILADSVRGLEEFNRAEALFQQGQYEQSKGKYLAAVPRARETWKKIIRVRYVMACDGAGDLVEAVQAFVELVEIFPEKADAFMPSNVKGPGLAQQEQSLKILENVLERTGNQMIYWQLEAMRLSILEQTESEHAGRVAKNIIENLQRGPSARSKYRLQMIAIRVEVRHEQYEVALGHLNELLDEADEHYLPEILFLKGQCLFGMAGNRDQLLRAGLVFMRVIVHFPESHLCAQSMYHVAEIHERIGRTRKAIELYKGCQELPGANDQLNSRAVAAAERLRT